MKVICINDKQILGYTDNMMNVLTIGKIYEAINRYQDYYELLSHDDDEPGSRTYKPFVDRCFLKERFITLREYNLSKLTQND
jgi:hypothetical protein